MVPHESGGSGVNGGKNGLTLHYTHRVSPFFPPFVTPTPGNEHFPVAIPPATPAQPHKARRSIYVRYANRMVPFRMEMSGR